MEITTGRQPLDVSWVVVALGFKISCFPHALDGNVALRCVARIWLRSDRDQYYCGPKTYRSLHSSFALLFLLSYFVHVSCLSTPTDGLAAVEGDVDISGAPGSQTSFGWVTPPAPPPCDDTAPQESGAG